MYPAKNHPPTVKLVSTGFHLWASFHCSDARSSVYVAYIYTRTLILHTIMMMIDVCSICLGIYMQHGSVFSGIQSRIYSLLVVPCVAGW